MEVPTIFCSENEASFEHQDSLPSLPVPQLSQTLKVYLDSVKVLVTSDEYERTNVICRDFASGIGQWLQNKLNEKAKHSRNWLERWWEDCAYLSNRGSLLCSNFTGPGPYFFTVWPPAEGVAVKRAALSTWFILQYWLLLRKEKLKVDRMGRQVWCMDQYRRIFSACRIPGKDKDTLNYYFKTEKEGPTPSHMTVMYRGRIFQMDCIDHQGVPLTPPELEHQLVIIRELADAMPKGPGIGALTADSRDRWFSARQHLVGLSARNGDHLQVLEESLFTLSFDEGKPTTYSEICCHGLVGGITDRWLDKSLNFIMFANGTVACNCDHAPYEAMVMINCTYLCLLGVNANPGGRWQQGDAKCRDFPRPTELSFEIDGTIDDALNSAHHCFGEIERNVQVLSTRFCDFGRDFIRSHKLHPDTFVQMALQLAYFQLHNKPAPTYETASIRKFWHGRTETLRACTTETVAWTKAMYDAGTPAATKMKKLKKAMAQHLHNMAQAMDMRGCDRHLFALHLMALESGVPMPDLFTDTSYTKSGGGGNYVLSTSYVGTTPVHGGVVPMRTDGYGFFYSIQQHSVTVFITAWAQSAETDVNKLLDCFQCSMLAIRDLIANTSAKL